MIEELHVIWKSSADTQVVENIRTTYNTQFGIALNFINPDRNFFWDAAIFTSARIITPLTPLCCHEALVHCDLEKKNKRNTWIGVHFPRNADDGFHD